MVLILVAKWLRNFRGTDIWPSAKCISICMTCPSRLVNYTLCTLVRRRCIGGVEVQFHLFLTSALYRGEWLTAHSCCCTYGEKTPGAVWEGPTAGPDVSDKTEICWGCQEWNPGPPSLYPGHCTDRAVGNNVNKTVILFIRVAVTVFFTLAGKCVKVWMKLCCLHWLWVEEGVWGTRCIWRGGCQGGGKGEVYTSLELVLEG